MKEYFLWLSKTVTLIILLGFFVPLLIGAALVGLTTALADRTALVLGKNTVAVVELTGDITEDSETVQELYKQINKDSVTGVVLRIDSAGGLVAPSQDIFSTVAKLKNKKPIVVSMGSVAASGGLYAALSASKIFAQPGTLTGSIGVVLQAPNFTRIADKIGFDMMTVKAGKLKDIGNSFRPITAEEVEFLEKLLGATHQEFIRAVVVGRNLPVAKVLEFSDGRILTGAQAKDLGLVDELGDVYDAARAVFELAGKPLSAEEIPQLLYREERFTEFKKMLGSVSSLLGGMQGRARISYLAY